MFLKIIKDETTLDEIEIPKDVIIIGRSEDCDITIDSHFISRKHLEIRKENGGIFLKDISSGNWVSYNNEPLSKEGAAEYFSFSTLALPGGFEIKVDVSRPRIKDPEENLNKTQDIYTNKVIPSSHQGIHHSIPQLKRSSPNSKGNSYKYYFYLVFIIIAVLVYGGYAFLNDFKSIKNTRVASQRDAGNGEFIIDGSYDHLTNKKKIIKKELKSTHLKNRIKSNKVINAKTDFDIKIEKAECRSPKTMAICSFLFQNSKQKDNLEGIVIEKNKIFIFKNKTMTQSRIKDINKNNIELNRRDRNKARLKSIRTETIPYTILAGYDILDPKFLQSLESQKIYSVQVYLFERVNNQISKLDSFIIKSSHYRRYDKNEYDSAYKALMEKADVSLFKNNLYNYIKKE